MVPVEVQFNYFGATILIGLLIGISFDIYREIIFNFKLRKMIVNVFDLVYWLLLTVLVFIILQHINYGEVRIYVFIGLALGSALYFYFLSFFVRKILRKVLSVVIRVTAVVTKIAKMPFIFVKKLFSPAGNFIYLIVFRCGGVLRAVKRLVKNLSKS